MKEVVEAAVAVASKMGARTTVIVIDGNGAPALAGVPQVPAPAAAPHADGAAAQIAVKHSQAAIDALTVEVQEYRTKLAQATNERDSLSARLTTALQAQQAGGGFAQAQAEEVAKERDAYRAKVGELEGLVASLRATPPAPAAAANPGAAEAAYQDYPIDVLALDPKLVKTIQKAAGEGITTVGLLARAFAAGKIKPKKEGEEGGHFTKDQVIDISNRLLGRIPRAVPSPDGAPAAPASSAPAGMPDRSWADRVAAARRKEAKVAEHHAKALASRAEVERLKKGEQNPDTRKALEVAQRVATDDEQTLILHESQLMAMIYCLGFEPDVFGKVRPKNMSPMDRPFTVDAIFQAAGYAPPAKPQPAPPAQQPVGATA